MLIFTSLIFFSPFLSSYIMRTCKKRSDRSNARTSTRCESCAKSWKVNKDSGEGFADCFSYFGKILHKGKGG